MLTRKIPFLLLIAICLVFQSCSGMKTARSAGSTSDPLIGSLIRVNVAGQGYNFHRPWNQGSPSTHTAIGVIVQGPRVLLTAQMIANHRYVELEKLETGRKGRAEVEVVDYEANLALLKAKDPDFLTDMRPLELTTEAVSGDLLTILQIKGNGNIAPSESPITSIELARQAFGGFFLTYRLNGSLQYRYNNATLPALKGRKLAGLLTGYDAKAQTIDILSAPILSHFLKEATGENYRGFPRFGVRVVPTDDPQLRRYEGIPDDLEGVYVQQVARGSAGEKAGIKVGDIIVEMAGYPVDRHGSYPHPLYGKVSLPHLIRCVFFAGDKIKVSVFRKGKTREIEIVPEEIPVKDFLVPPYVVDTPPRYYILGGLVLQELSLSYLQEYGSQWLVKAPIGLVNYQKNQHAIDPGGREKIVFLSQVLRTSQTIGYGSLTDLVVTRINHKAINKLEDVPRALETPVKGFHRVEFEEHPKVIYIDPAEIEGINRQIRQRYNLPALQNIAIK